MVSTRTTSQTVSELEEIMRGNASLEEAVASLHKKSGVGLMYIWPAISEILKVEKREAKRLCVEWCRNE